MLRAVPGDIFVESTVDSQTAALRERYRRAGYRDVRIELVMEERDAAATAARSGSGRPGRRPARRQARATWCASAPSGCPAWPACRRPTCAPS